MEHDRALAKPYFWPCLKSVQMAGIPAPHGGRILTSVTGQGFWLLQLPLSTAAAERYGQSWRQKHVPGTGAVGSREQVRTLPLPLAELRPYQEWGAAGHFSAGHCQSCRNLAPAVVLMGDSSPGCNHRRGHRPGVSQMWGDKAGLQASLGNVTYMQSGAFIHLDANSVKTIWRTESQAKLTV